MNQSQLAKPCVLCNDSTDDPIELGEMLADANIRAHWYCLLLSSNLYTKGEDDEGMYGFLLRDVIAEVNRVKRIKCTYCKKGGASIGCYVKKCKWSFHLPCALQRECKFEFVGNYDSYCERHHGIEVPENCHKPTDNCSICFEEMGNYKPVGSVQSPCCSNWFHKRCLMATANAAGYFFKCPLCQNAKIFREKIPKRGIFIPERDAAWETELDNYAELHERPMKCSAKICKYPDGRNYAGKKIPKLSFIYCEYCGSKGIHKRCNESKDFQCSDCVPCSDEEDNENDENEVETRESEHAKLELSSEDGSRERIDLDNSNSSCAPTKSIQYTRSTCSSPKNNSTELDVESDDDIRSVDMNQSAEFHSSDEEHIVFIATKTASGSITSKRDFDADETSSTSIITQNLTKKIASDDDDGIKPIPFNLLRTISRLSHTNDMEKTAEGVYKRKRSAKLETNIDVKLAKRCKLTIVEYIIESDASDQRLNEYPAKEKSEVKKE